MYDNNELKIQQYGLQIEQSLRLHLLTKFDDEMHKKCNNMVLP